MAFCVKLFRDLPSQDCLSLQLMKTLVLFISVCVLSHLSYSQNNDSLFIRRIAEQILKHGKAYEDLRILTKTVGARLAGSPGMYKAEAWGM